MTVTTELTAAEIEQLRALANPPRPPLPTCWCCGRRTGNVVEDVFLNGRALCRACLASSPSASADARPAGVLAALLAAGDDSHLAAHLAGVPGRLRAVLGTHAGSPVAASWLRLAGDEAGVRAWCDSGADPADARFAHISEDQADRVECCLATEVLERERLSVPPPIRPPIRSVAGLGRPVSGGPTSGGAA